MISGLRGVETPVYGDCNCKLRSKTNRAPEHGDSKTPYLHLTCTVCDKMIIYVIRKIKVGNSNGNFP